MGDLTTILSRIEQGDPRAAGRLLPLVYDELRKLAAARLANEANEQSLQATALVHEAYLRIVGPDPTRPFDGRGHFFAAAAEAMRRILIDRARDRNRLKRGGGRRRVRIDLDSLLDEPPGDDLLALDEALSLLASDDPNAARLVKLRVFAGLTIAQAAEARRNAGVAQANDDLADRRSQELTAANLHLDESREVLRRNLSAAEIKLAANDWDERVIPRMRELPARQAPRARPGRPAGLRMR